MNRLLGISSALTVAAALLGFALSLVLGDKNGSYAASLALSWAYVVMAVSFWAVAESDRNVAGGAGTAFAILYAGFATTVYFVQLTPLPFGGLPRPCAPARSRSSRPGSSSPR